MKDARVRPPVTRLTDDDARHLLSAGLIRACHEMRGPKRVALEAGCDEKTIRRARDEESNLGLASAVNLAGLPGNPLDELFAEVGYRLVPLGSRCDTDVLISTSAAVHHIASARDRRSPGGEIETDDELLGMEEYVDEAIVSLSALKERIIAIKRQRTARWATNSR